MPSKKNAQLLAGVRLRANYLGVVAERGAARSGDVFRSRVKAASYVGATRTLTKRTRNAGQCFCGRNRIGHARRPDKSDACDKWRRMLHGRPPLRIGLRLQPKQ